MVTDAETVIIGAGPAGCCCAAELMRHNSSVIIFEKGPKGAYKPCAGGIGLSGCTLLANIDFPMDRFYKIAVPIATIYIYNDGTLHKKPLTSENAVFGTCRSDLNLLFQTYAEECGANIRYATPVHDIISVPGGYDVNGVVCKNIVLACGVYAYIMIDGKPLLPSFRSKLPVAICAEIEGTSCEEPYFYFDYDVLPSQLESYAWIFSIGKNRWSIGIGAERSKGNIISSLHEFYESQVRLMAEIFFPRIRKSFVPSPDV